MLRNLINRLKIYREPAYAFGAGTSILGGAGYGGYKMMESCKNEDFINTTAMTCFGVWCGACAGVVGWFTAPVIAVIAGAVYVHKKINNDKKI